MRAGRKQDPIHCRTHTHDQQGWPVQPKRGLKNGDLMCWLWAGQGGMVTRVGRPPILTSLHAGQAQDGVASTEKHSLQLASGGVGCHRAHEGAAF